MELKIDIKTPQQLRRLWCVDVALAIIAGLVLLLALASALGAFVPRGASLQERIKKGGDEDASLAKVDSPLLVEAKAFTAKWLTPPPPPPPPPKPVTPTKLLPTPPITKPVENPKPVEPPKPIAPPPPARPNFNLVATIVAGNGYGWAWIQKPGKTDSQLVLPGDDVDGYTITRVEEGKMMVFIKGHEFDLEVPKPQPGAPVAAPTPAPAVAGRPTMPGSAPTGRPIPSRPPVRPPRTIPNREPVNQADK